MVVECILNLVPEVEGLVNSDLRGYVEIGDKFVVYGMTIRSSFSCYIVYNGSHLLEVPMQMFKIIDNNISPAWQIKCIDEEVRIWPELFYEEYFFDKFSDWESRERADFEGIKKEFFAD